MKTIIERGASWTLEETKLLLSLWGKDLVQRQATNTKRTREVYEKISEQFLQNGFERTSDQVRTRVFNMIAEYRRILKDHNPERQKKCIFYEALHKIYQAKHLDDVKSALDDYEPEYPYSPLSASNTIPDSSERGDESVSDGEATDGNETINNASTLNLNNTATTTNNNNNTLNDTGSGDSNNNASTEKESSSANSHAAGTPSSNKRIKLESPKSGQNQTTNQVTNNTNAASTSMVNSATPSSSAAAAAASDHSSNNSKVAAKTLPVPLAATTIGGASIASTSSSSSSSSSSQRHQSLLLPHATTSSTTTSTPMSKLTTSAGGNNTPSYININSAKLPIIRTNQLISHPNGTEPINLNGTTTRLPTTAAITSHQLYQAPVNTFDVTSSALLIDRMFAHLSRESENMREWIALEKERIALERTRRQQETEREVRRERVLIDTLMRFQEQWLSYISRLDPRAMENANEIPPEPKIPPRDGTSAETSQSTQASNTTTTTTTNSNSSNTISSESSKQ